MAEKVIEGRVYLSAEQVALIDRVAKHLGVSRSHFIRTAVIEKAAKGFQEMNMEETFKVYADAAYVRDGKVTRVRVDNVREFDQAAQPEDFVAVVPSMMTDEEILAIRK